MSARKRNANLTKVSEETIALKKRISKLAASAPEPIAMSSDTTPIRPKRKVAKNVTSRKASIKKANSKKTVSDSVVELPSAVGPRLESKAQFLSDLLEDLHIPVYRIAYVSAVCFVLIGAFTAFTELVDLPRSQSAQLCATGVCTGPGQIVNNESGSTISTSPAVSLNPEVQMLDLVPSIINEDIKLSFKVLHGTNVVVSLLSSASGGLYQTEVTKLSNENYQVIIPAASLPDAQYSIRVFVTKLDGTGTYSFPGGRFEVPKPPAEPVVPTVPEVSEPTAADSVATSTPSNESPDSVSDTDTIPNTVSEPVRTTEILKPATIEPNPIDVSDDDVDFLPSGTAAIEKPFKILVADSLFSGREAIRVTAPTSYYSIELFIRSELAVEARYLGLMNKEFDRWIYSFDTSNIPNGAYEVFARAKSTAGVHTTDSIVVRVKNEVIVTEPIRLEPASTSTNPDTQRNFYLYEASEDSDIISSTLSEVVAVEVKNILSKEQSSINDLLERYAVAKQSGNEMVLEAVQREFKERKEQMITEALLNDETKDIASQIGTSLEERIIDLQNRVDTFENIRASRENKLISIDSDNDGISDFDETALYNTDPNNPDTDQDGFIDGAEIARGFDPLDDRPEVVVAYELPQEAIGLARPEVLSITGVKPFVQVNDDSSVIMAEVSGKGLPNTFATIYIFSTPTIVTVKTSDDGSFTYRFEKELEDGSHEVYVAFTDNAGAILAHSEPFQFIKQAQAFTPVDAEPQSVVTTAPNVVEASTINAIRLVLAMAIIVLGFMLLMLGINLRSSAPAKSRGHSLGV